MNNRMMIERALILSYRNSIEEVVDEAVNRLVKDILKEIRLPEEVLGTSGEREMIEGLLELIQEIMDGDFTTDSLVGELKIICGKDYDFHESLSEIIGAISPGEDNKKEVISLTRKMSAYFKSQKVNKIIGQAYYNLQNGDRDDNKATIAQLLTDLEQHSSTGSYDDPAVVDEFMLGDKETATELLQKAKDRMAGELIYKTGWIDLNKSLQGGFRPGNFVLIPAMEHRNKSGFTRSLFKQLVIYNIAQNFLKNKKLKPLAMHLSFEDDLSDNVQYIYNNIMFNRTGEYVDTKKVTAEQMEKVVREELSRGGFDIHMARIDPSTWAYYDIQNRVKLFESKGFEVKILMLDYLGKIAPTGCEARGGTGTDIREMLSRMRNFCSARDILLITPWQFGPVAKNMLAGGVSDKDLLRELRGIGAESGSKQLGQEPDIILNLHSWRKDENHAYFNVDLAKHKIPVAVADVHTRMFFQYPDRGMPIPDDLPLGEPISKKSFNGFTNPQDAGFF